MEAAAETVRLLTHTILPERPHQLAQSPDWRVTNEERPKRVEEWDHSRLQYMTFVSDGDRGVLFTRNYYDIRPEPPRPVSREVNILSKGGAKKLSLSDYNKKKTGATTSASPPDTTNSPSLKKPGDRLVPLSSDPSPPEESRRSTNKSGHVESQGSSKFKTTSSESIADSRYAKQRQRQSMRLHLICFSFVNRVQFTTQAIILTPSASFTRAKKTSQRRRR